MLRLTFKIKKDVTKDTLLNEICSKNRININDIIDWHIVKKSIDARNKFDVHYVYVLDFKFKNNRNYPIKINCSVSGGIANFQIFGLKQDDDYDVEISSYETGRTATAIYSEAYKILKKDGKVVNKQLLSKDTYKRH